MNAEEKHIKIFKTARYYSLGELNEQTKNVWIVLHGHKQLADDFINTFSELAQNGYYIMAPEGLSKFYLKGYYGEIGASWMTKVDRQNEINDYVGYLDRLYDEEILNKHVKSNFKVTALGFSQGAATLSRWLALGESRIDKAIFWCGTLAQDIDYSIKSGLHSTGLHIVCSDNDQYIPLEQINKQTELIKKNGLNPKTYMFHGTHEINMKLLKETGLV